MIGVDLNICEGYDAFFEGLLRDDLNEIIYYIELAMILVSLNLNRTSKN